MTLTPPVESAGTGPASPDGPLARLRGAVRGRVVLPGEDAFPVAAMAWNVAVAQRPAAVVEVVDAADVCAVVRAARDLGLAVAAQPGGHGATRALDDAVLLRTAALDEVWVDADAGVARVGAGVKWGQLVAALDGTGRIALAGSNPDVSVVGYLLGGGLSWFSRRYGIAASTLRAVELVDGAGRQQWVTDDSDPELMWALRGGGGEFGVVTRVEVALPEQAELHGGKLAFPVSEAAAVLGAFTEVTAGAPDGLTCWAWIIHAPDAPVVPEPMRGQSFVGVDVTWLGPAAEGEALIAPLRRAGTVLMDTVGPVPIGRLGEVAAEPTDPTPALDWSTTLGSFDAGTIERMLAAAGDRTRSALTSIQIRHLGGALATPSGPPAVVGSCPGEYLVFALGIPAVPELAGPIRASHAALAEALAAESLDRVTPTMLGHEMPVSAALDADTLGRLRAIKDRVDPGGVIRGNHPLA